MKEVTMKKYYVLGYDLVNSIGSYVRVIIECDVFEKLYDNDDIRVFDDIEDMIINDGKDVFNEVKIDKVKDHLVFELNSSIVKFDY